MSDRADPGPAPFQGAQACGCCVSGGYASLHHRLMSIGASGAKNVSSDKLNHHLRTISYLLMVRSLRLRLKLDKFGESRL